MGEDRQLSWVSSEGQAHYYSNLSVMDGSVFPSSLGANPQLSIYGLTARNASLLARRLKPEPAEQDVAEAEVELCQIGTEIVLLVFSDAARQAIEFVQYQLLPSAFHHQLDIQHLLVLGLSQVGFGQASQPPIGAQNAAFPLLHFAVELGP